MSPSRRTSATFHPHPESRPVQQRSLGFPPLTFKRLRYRSPSIYFVSPSFPDFSPVGRSTAASPGFPPPVRSTVPPLLPQFSFGRRAITFPAVPQSTAVLPPLHFKILSEGPTLFLHFKLQRGDRIDKQPVLPHFLRPLAIQSADSDARPHRNIRPYISSGKGIKSHLSPQEEQPSCNVTLRCAHRTHPHVTRSSISSPVFLGNTTVAIPGAYLCRRVGRP